MIFKSIKWRLQIWHSIILVVVLAGFGFTAYHVARDSQLRRVDQDLEQELMVLSRPDWRGRGPRPGGPMPPGPDAGPSERAERQPGFPPQGREFAARLKQAVEALDALGRDRTNGTYFVVWNRDGSLVARSSAAPEAIPPPVRAEPVEQFDPQRSATREPTPRLRGGPPTHGEARTRGMYREVYRHVPGGDCLLAGRSLAAELAAMRQLSIWLVLAGAGVLLLGLGGSWWLATRAIRPIEDISNTAGRIAAGDLSQRISAADTDNELGRLAAVLNSTFARLEAAFAQQARFTSDASHELRTPVSVILSQTQGALSRSRSEAEYRETLEACQRAAQRMRKLTESLLQLARLDTGQEQIKRDSFDLARVARESIELMQPLAAEKRIKMDVDLAPAECMGDPERIAQVATNLLSNAIFFNRNEGEVRISTQVQNGAAVLAVTDTGEGIPAEDLPHIFERFYRGDKARSGVQGRTGLGLAISKAIVDAHSGTIEVQSQPGAGTTFTLKLPRD